ncbi:ArgP/LysG family DNA-binding transcriptional regulator [Nocardioides sambongensis]|uniref:ArgP/LysG family DNA-binding transcriptional regulator n=1 Tax=Nocardioides sambongensis TaxID=2589074 RepID=UPI0018C8933B|nr:ArgP/LysG family DNA-binding transcriptional regulator [Nocardioides sambongensis]
MEPQPNQLAALVAIAEHGTFEAAARALHVTPSAISQRIRALEAQAGRVLVTRGAPCRPTDAATGLVRLGRQLRLLYDEADLGDHAPTEVSVAVNADSLAGWFRGVLADVGGWGDVALRLAIEDQAHSHELLRGGEVMGAVTSDPTPVQGCSVRPLGTLTYVAAAAPALLARYDAAPDWRRMPVVRFNDKDLLQDQELAAHGVPAPPLTHRVPSSDDFLAAVVAGLGWGMLPAHQLVPAEERGEVVRIGRRAARVPLHWQRWRLDSPVLDRLTASVLAHRPG